MSEKLLFPIHCAVTCGKALLCASCLAELEVSEDHQLFVRLCPELFCIFFYPILKANVKVEARTCQIGHTRQKTALCEHDVGPWAHSWDPCLYLLLFLGPSGRTDLKAQKSGSFFTPTKPLTFPMKDPTRAPSGKVSVMWTPAYQDPDEMNYTHAGPTAGS